MSAGVLLACDVGTVRIGVARSDAGRILAVPLASVPAGEDSISALLALVLEYSAVEIIVGLPLKMDGTEGASAEMARSWAAKLAANTDLPVRLVDERLTTVQAQRGLHAAGRTVKNSRSAIDSASAAVLLQSVLESRTDR
ncbi:MAG: Holliday junction resolvase RuvX [Actinomycetota bacterium]|nr:Holliday junction resolvase RuvX [Actinomycetota bacterium]